MKIERLTNWLACRKKLMNAFIRGAHLIPDKNNKKEKKKNSRHSSYMYRERFIRIATNFLKANFALFFRWRERTASPAEHFLIKRLHR